MRGELTQVKVAPSGHLYATLKDATAVIGLVMWRSQVVRNGALPRDGEQVEVRGALSVYAPRGQYQLIATRIAALGQGDLAARFAALKAKLLAEGLFAEEGKLPLPVLPRAVGLATAAGSAALADLLHSIRSRFPRMPVVLASCLVQGVGAPAQIVAALQRLDRHPEVDVIVVGRGGGSIEDLWAFNDEAVVRAAAACTIPLISAVGHETDTTLIDFVSDRRAPTPTAAAEMAIPARSELLADLLQKAARLEGSLGRTTQEKRLRLQRAERGLPDLPSLLGTARQRLDDRGQRLGMALPNLLAARHAALARAERGLPDLPALVAGARRTLADRGLHLRLALPNVVSGRHARLILAGAQLRSALRHAVSGRAAVAARVLPRLTAASVHARLREAQARLDGAGARLESVSHKAVQARGYALVLDAGGHPVSLASQVAPGAALRLGFLDGEVAVTANGGRPRQASLEL